MNNRICLLQELHHASHPLVSCPHCSERHPFNEVAGHYVACVAGKGWKMGRCSKRRGRFPKQGGIKLQILSIFDPIAC